MLNNAPLVHALAQQLNDNLNPTCRPVQRRRCTSEPILLPGYPSSSVLQREAERGAHQALLNHLTSISIQQSLEEDHELGPRERRAGSTSTASLPSPKSPTSDAPMKAIKGIPKLRKDPEPFEILRAVERKDIMFLMEVRDRAFHLLLQKHGDATPLLHSMRIGASHKEVSIILLGAFSRWINHLEDDQIELPRTRTLLKALRTNLKLAIDFGLHTSQKDLIASFMQTLIMSEGDKWVRYQAHNVAQALKARTGGRPVKEAEAAVRSFATRQLGKAELIPSLEDYITNATSDLLMMGAWTLLSDFVQVELIPTYCFARDDRVYKMFCDGVHKHRAAIEQKVRKRLRWQLRVLRDTLEGRAVSNRRKVDNLAKILDVDDPNT